MYCKNKGGAHVQRRMNFEEEIAKNEEATIEEKIEAACGGFGSGSFIYLIIIILVIVVLFGGFGSGFGHGFAYSNEE